jgi:hypothetical protein
LQLRDDPEAIAPERAIVFEVAGSVLDFYKQASSVGLEYLADDELELQPTEDFHLTKHPQAAFGGRAYLAMPDLNALQQMLRVWRIYKDGGRMPRGFGVWTKMFGLLKDVRAWGPQDRVLPETLEYWKSRLAERPGEAVRFEIELWFRQSNTVRAAKAAAVSERIHALGGAVLHHATIVDIRYDALLVDLPAGQIEELIAHPDLSLALSDEVMFLRPQSMARFPDVEERDDDIVQVLAPGEIVLPPIAALLDGLPVQNHHRLRDRLVIEDPDGLEGTYTIPSRRHGTEMASLIVHGDLNANEQPIGRPLYVRPILAPTADGQEERTPADRLLVDLIYQAVRRVKEGDGTEPASAPTVVLFNLSIGDTNRPFAGPMSPCARLLDFLAYRYRVLFLISAGNVTNSFPIPEFATWGAFEAADPDLRERAILNALHRSKAYRTLLSPAESLNAITVGAAHRDLQRGGTQPHNAIDPWTNGDLPNVSSAFGLGHRRVVKPDILMSGGRELVRMRASNPLEIAPVIAAQRAFGLLTAAPDPAGASLQKTALTFGTSAATALATRTAHQILDVLSDADGGSMHLDIPLNYQALVAKAMLLHGASWGSKSQLLEEVFGPREHDARKDNVARVLGYGPVDVGRVVECTQNRATLLGFGSIAEGEAALYRIPLPSGLESAREFRAVTFTVAWFSPINARHQAYRAAALAVTPGGDENYSLAVDRASDQPNFNAVKRGSALHERREGSRAAAFVDGGDLLFRLSCRATAGDLADNIPYAVAVSIEVGIGSAIQVYDEVRAEIDLRLKAKLVPVQP